MHSSRFTRVESNGLFLSLFLEIILVPSVEPKKKTPAPSTFNQKHQASSRYPQILTMAVAPNTVDTRKFTNMIRDQDGGFSLVRKKDQEKERKRMMREIWP
jgi:hypothetical protein